MTHERDQSHATTSADTSRDREELEPGRASRSALMRKPDHAIASGLVQRAARDANGVAEGAEAAVAAASSSSGSALPATLMRKFESSLGADLSGVRVHTGESSAAANDAVGAKAYTMGNDIHFGAGQYDPSSPAGEHLLAHEVAHTVQQSGGAQRMQFKLSVSSPGDSLEHEADHAASAMVTGARAALSSTTGGLGRQVFRADKPKDAGVDPQQVQTVLKQIDAAQARLIAVDDKIRDGAKTAKTAYTNAATTVGEQYKTFEEAYKSVKDSLKEAKEGIDGDDEFKKFLVDTALTIVTGAAGEGLKAAEGVAKSAPALVTLGKEVLKEVGAEELSTIVNNVAGTDTTGKDKVVLDGDAVNPAKDELDAKQKLEAAKDKIDVLDDATKDFLRSSQAIGRAHETLNTAKTPEATKKLPQVVKSVPPLLAKIEADCGNAETLLASALKNATFAEQLAQKQRAAATKGALEREIWARWLGTLDQAEFTTLRDKDGIVEKLKLYGLYTDFGGTDAARAKQAIGKTAQSYGKEGLAAGLFRVRVTGTNGTFVAVREKSPSPATGTGALNLNLDLDIIPAGTFGTVVGVDSAGNLIVAAQFVGPDQTAATFVDGDEAAPVAPISMADALKMEKAAGVKKPGFEF